MEVTVGFLFGETPPEGKELGKVNFFFPVVGDGSEEDDGRDREYLEDLDFEEDCVGIGIRDLPDIFGGELGIDGSTDGFDLLYFEDAEGGDPLPEYPLLRSYLDASLGPFACATPPTKTRSTNAVVDLFKNMDYSLFD